MKEEGTPVPEWLTRCRFREFLRVAGVGSLPPCEWRPRPRCPAVGPPPVSPLEIAGRNEIRFQAARWVDHAFNAAFPCRVIIDTEDVGKNIEAFRVTSKRKKLLRPAKSSGRMPSSGAPNSASAAYVDCALAGSAFMKVLRKARLRVKMTAKPSHNEVFNPIGRRLKVFVVLIHPARSPTLSVRRRSESFRQRLSSGASPAPVGLNDAYLVILFGFQMLRPPPDATGGMIFRRSSAVMFNFVCVSRISSTSGIPHGWRA